MVVALSLLQGTAVVVPLVPARVDLSQVSSLVSRLNRLVGHRPLHKLAAIFLLDEDLALGYDGSLSSGTDFYLPWTLRLFYSLRK